MMEPQIHTAFVSNRVEVDQAAAVEAVEALAGTTIRAGMAHLTIDKRIGEGLAGAAWFSGRLHTGTLLLPSVRVDVVVSPWSATRSEIGIRPLGTIGTLGSARVARFLRSAWPIVDALIARITAGAAPSAAVPVLQIAA